MEPPATKDERTVGGLRKRILDLERQIHESGRREARYRSFLRATHAAVWDWDIAANRTCWNAALESVFGYAPETVIPDFAWWSGRIHPEDRARILAGIDEALKSDVQTWADEYRFQRHDGRYAWVVDRGYIERDQQGRAVQMLGAMLDISDRKAAEQALRDSEERFRRLSESNVIGIVTADRERICEANEAFLTMVGHTNDEVAAGELTWSSIIAPEYQHLLADSLRELRETGLMRAHEKEYVRKDGKRVPVMVGGAMLRSSPARAILFVLDLSEIKDLERRLREAQRWESIGLLAGGIAHDFNNLLTTIIGNAALARDLVSEPEARAYLNEAIESGQRAARLTSQLLAYAGKARLVLEPTHVSEVVRGLSDRMRAAAPAPIETSLELTENLPEVKADRRAIEQVVLALISNAAEAIGPQAGRITVRTRVREAGEEAAHEPAAVGQLSPGTLVVIEVEDTGRGMTEETKARIFDPFFSTKFAGRGLALAAAAGVVKMQRGAIQVFSGRERGTLFRVLLPASR